MTQDKVAPRSLDGLVLEDFFENAAIGLHIVAADGTILRANKAELDMLGYLPDEYIGKPITFFHVDQHVIEQIMKRLSQGEMLEQYPARLRAKDGSIRHVRITSSGQFQDGKFVQTRCFTTDVTDAIHAELRFQQVLDALPAAVYTTNAEGRVTYYNQAAVDLAGRRPQIGVDEWCVTWRLYTKEGNPLPHDQCPMAIALKENRPVRGIEAWAERPNGKRIPFIPYPTPLYDESGRMTGAINMLVDISDRKQAEDTKQLLINELNHRVKNTLAIIQALAHQTMRRAQSPNDFVTSFSGRLEVMARTHTLLSQSTWKGAELSTLFRDELLMGGDADSRIIWSGPELLLAPQQALHVALIIHELATNARKYGALATADGKLSVDWSIKSNGGRKLHLHWVEESSPTILKRASSGGFGTTFIQQIVSPDGGSAQMSYHAKGITWDINLGLQGATDIADEVSRLQNRIPRSNTDISLEGMKILIVEDEALIAMELDEAIRNAGAESEIATKVAEALRKISESNFDAAILDVNLNGKRSDVLAAALTRRNIPFAFVTGYGRDTLPAAFRQAALLSKPFNPSEVAQTLTSLFDTPRPAKLRPVN